MGPGEGAGGVCVKAEPGIAATMQKKITVQKPLRMT